MTIFHVLNDTDFLDFIKDILFSELYETLIYSITTLIASMNTGSKVFSINNLKIFYYYLFASSLIVEKSNWCHHSLTVQVCSFSYLNHLKAFVVFYVLKCHYNWSAYSFFLSILSALCAFFPPKDSYLCLILESSHSLLLPLLSLLHLFFALLLKVLLVSHWYFYY